ncbi:hypothetical protein ACTXT7_010442 [Hymenolepis weldensis]
MIHRPQLHLIQVMKEIFLIHTYNNAVAIFGHPEAQFPSPTVSCLIDGFRRQGIAIGGGAEKECDPLVRLARVIVVNVSPENQRNVINRLTPPSNLWKRDTKCPRCCINTGVCESLTVAIIYQLLPGALHAHSDKSVGSNLD